MPRGFLHLLALRSRTSLLQHADAASKPDCGSGGAPTAATSRVRKDGSIIATVSESTGAAGVQAPRDGSRFPFDHFPGIIRLWNGRCIGTGSAASGAASALAGNSARCMAALPDLRPHRALHRSVSTHSTTKVRPI